MIKAANAMAKCLIKEGVKVVFGYPGAAICPFYDALSNTNIKHILVRHEQNAGHAASGYARMTNKPAVCIATSGPGALNLITAIATAYMDSIPLVIITGQVSSDMLGRDVFQEADITGAAEPFVKHSYLVKEANDIPRVFKEAFYLAATGRPGPVLIDVPVDVQNKMIDFNYPTEISIRGYKPHVLANLGQINRILSAVKKSKKPLICAGGGVFFANAKDELLSFSKKANIPIVSTMMGISSVPCDYPLFLGMIGMHGCAAANKAVRDSDLLILIGARVGDRAIMSPDGISNTTTVIHIDIDPAEIGKNMKTHIPLVGDAKDILGKLSEFFDAEPFLDWTSDIKKVSLYDDNVLSLSPKKVISKLCKGLDDNAVLVADVGQNQIWSARNFNIKNGRFLTSGGMGTMGYSIPAAIGAKLAQSNRQVVAICGDGSFQMQMMELATIAQNDLNIKIILMNNTRLGMVRELQDKQYAGNKTAVFLDGNPDFAALANAYSIKSLKITNDNEIDNAIDKMLKHDGTFLLECIIDPDAQTL